MSFNIYSPHSAPSVPSIPHTSPPLFCLLSFCLPFFRLPCSPPVDLPFSKMAPACTTGNSSCACLSSPISPISRYFILPPTRIGCCLFKYFSVLYSIFLKSPSSFFIAVQNLPSAHPLERPSITLEDPSY